ncbi:MAG: ABC transporter ATP-binding protein, partial [Oscillochloris sp.]|nr:ABC transporter ATP-binding protein [Oscillochloris sp.]
MSHPLDNLPTWRLNRRLIAWGGRDFWLHSFFHSLFLVAPIALGLIERSVFDNITGATPATLSLWTLIALYVGVGLAQLATSFADIWAEVGFRYRTGARLRHNLLATLLRRPGALPSPVPVGEAISRYRNDVAEVTDFPLWLPHVGGSLLMFVIAVVLM